LGWGSRRGENQKLIKENCFVVWLKASPEVLAERIKHSQNRPSLTGKDFLEEISEVACPKNTFLPGTGKYKAGYRKFPPTELAWEIFKALSL